MASMIVAPTAVQVEQRDMGGNGASNALAAKSNGKVVDAILRELGTQHQTEAERSLEEFLRETNLNTSLNARSGFTSGNAADAASAAYDALARANGTQVGAAERPSFIHQSKGADFSQETARSATPNKQPGPLTEGTRAETAIAAGQINEVQAAQSAQFLEPRSSIGLPSIDLSAETMPAAQFKDTLSAVREAAAAGSAMAVAEDGVKLSIEPNAEEKVEALKTEAIRAALLKIAINDLGNQIEEK